MLAAAGTPEASNTAVVLQRGKRQQAEKPGKKNPNKQKNLQMQLKKKKKKPELFKTVLGWISFHTPGG